MGGSLNRGTPKSSILQTFHYKLSILGTSIYGNLQLFKQQPMGIWSKEVTRRQSP